MGYTGGHDTLTQVDLEFPTLEPAIRYAEQQSEVRRAETGELGGDRRAIFQAAAHTQRAVAYLQDLQPIMVIGREAA